MSGDGFAREAERLALAHVALQRQRVAASARAQVLAHRLVSWLSAVAILLALYDLVTLLVAVPH